MKRLTGDPLGYFDDALALDAQSQETVKGLERAIRGMCSRPAVAAEIKFQYDLATLRQESIARLITEVIRHAV